MHSENSASECESKTWTRVQRARNAKGFDDVLELYSDWADTYEEDNVNGIKTAGPRMCATVFHKYASIYGLNKQCKLLDACAGTGLVAKELKNMGYTNVDGHDGSQEMLNKGIQANLFKETVCGEIGNGKKLLIQSDTYDSVLMNGAFAHGHIKCDAFLELFRIVKPGGVIVNATRNEVFTTIDEYAKFPQLVESWSKDGLIEILEITIPKEKYYLEFDAIIHVFKVK